YAADLLVRALDVLGLASLETNPEASADALALAVERAAARAAGDYARADELRDEIAALGFSVRDTPQGPQVVPLDGASRRQAAPRRPGLRAAARARGAARPPACAGGRVYA